MRLIEIVRQILCEQDDTSVSLEFPKEKFTVSIDKKQKKLIFIPQENSPLANKIRPMVLMLKRNFNVISIKNQEDSADSSATDEQGQEVDPNDPSLRGVLLVELDPRENVDKVVEFLTSQIE